MSAPARVRVAVLGAGSWTCVNHLPAIEARDDVELVACLDPLLERREQVERRFPFTVVTDSLDEALAAKPDAVIVGATPDVQEPLVRAALEAGCHVLCEKPFTMHAVDAWSLVRLAEHHDRHLLTAFGWNYAPITERALALLDEHGIGEPEHVQIHMATALREMYQELMPVWVRPEEFLPVPSSYTRLEKGAGYAQAQLSHALGLALLLVPLRARAVFAFMADPNARVDLHDAVAVQFDNGATGSFSGACCPLGANENKHQLEVRIFGSEGQLLLDYDRERVWLYRDADADVELEVSPGDGAYPGEGPANALVDLAAGSDRPNRSSGELAARTTEIVEAAYLARRSGSVQAIAVAEQSR